MRWTSVSTTRKRIIRCNPVGRRDGSALQARKERAPDGSQYTSGKIVSNARAGRRAYSRAVSDLKLLLSHIIAFGGGEFRPLPACRLRIRHTLSSRLVHRIFNLLCLPCARTCRLCAEIRPYRSTHQVGCRTRLVARSLDAAQFQ